LLRDIDPDFRGSGTSDDITSNSGSRGGSDLPTGATMDSSALTRLDIITHTISTLRRIHNENETRRGIIAQLSTSGMTSATRGSNANSGSSRLPQPSTSMMLGNHPGLAIVQYQQQSQPQSQLSGISVSMDPMYRTARNLPFTVPLYDPSSDHSFHQNFLSTSSSQQGQPTTSDNPLVQALLTEELRNIARRMTLTQQQTQQQQASAAAAATSFASNNSSSSPSLESVLRSWPNTPLSGMDLLVLERQLLNINNHNNIQHHQHHSFQNTLSIADAASRMLAQQQQFPQRTALSDQLFRLQEQERTAAAGRSYINAPSSPSQTTQQQQQRQRQQQRDPEIDDDYDDDDSDDDDAESAS
jgi:hypothetical protein